MEILIRRDVPALSAEITALVTLANLIQFKMRLAQQTIDAILVLFATNGDNNGGAPSLTPEILLSLTPAPRPALSLDVRHNLLRKVSGRCLRAGFMAETVRVSD